MVVTSPRQEQVSDAGTTPIESRAGSQPLDDFQVDDIKEAPNKLLFGQRDTSPELVRSFDYVEPFRSCRCVVFRQPMIEEFLDGLRLHACVGDQADESRSYVSNTYVSKCQKNL